MGKKMRAIERLVCPLCEAEGYAPCVHRVTGKPIKGFHGPRIRQGLTVYDNARDEFEDKAFYMWIHLLLGGKESNYDGHWNGMMMLRGTELLPVLVPVTREEWKDLYRKNPEVDPDDQYHGSF